MPSRGLTLNHHRPYHVVSRAVQNLTIFQDEEDQNRFIFQMYAANVGKPALNIYRADMGHLGSALLQGEEIPERFIVRQHVPLVDFFSFVLAQDHYHLGLVARAPEGVSRYMKKLNIGFAKYYNLKRARKGPLFESRFRAVPVKTPRHLEALIRYLNVKKLLDLHEPAWESEGLKDVSQALEFFHQYRFSSFPDLFTGRGSHLIGQDTLEKLSAILGAHYLQRSHSYLRALEAFQKQETLVWPEIVVE